MDLIVEVSPVFHGYFGDDVSASDSLDVVVG